MGYVVLTGGARSGKSSAAERMAAASGKPVTMVATAEALDGEMADRIARHRAARPAGWETVEAPRDVVEAVASLDSGRFVLVDCLTLWVSNLFLDRDDAEVLSEADRLGEALRSRDGVVVTNEVGDGIVPADPMTRRYRDLLGMVNARLADGAEAVWLMTAGRAIRTEPAPW